MRKHPDRSIGSMREALRASQNLNRAVFDHSPVGISVRDRSGNLIIVNRAWRKIWRLSNRQIAINERISKKWSLQKRYPYLKNMIPRFRRIFKCGGELFVPEVKIDNPKPGAAQWISQYYYAICNRQKKVEQVVILTQDITDHKLAEIALRESDIRFRTIIENVNVGVYRTSGDPRGRFIQMNPALVRIFGYKSAKAMMKTRVIDLYHNRKDRYMLIKELSQKSMLRNREILMRKKDGSLIWISLYARAQLDDKGKVRWIDGVLEDITERKLKEEQLRALSLIDDLTGLYNRRGFLALAKHRLEIVQQKNNDLVLLYIDLDNLKEINDQYGHPIGDQALIETTRILKLTFRGSDIIARIGGDEFVVLSSETAKIRAQNLLLRIKASLDAFNKKAKLPFRLELSIGWTHHDHRKPKTISQLLASADRSMYHHKMIKKTNAAD